MDNTIGSGWNNNISPLQGQRPAFTPKPIEQEAAPSTVGDQVTLQGGAATVEPQAEAAFTSPAAPQTQAPVARESVPVNLLAEDFGTGLLGNSQPTTSTHPTASLGVLAQLDEAAPVRAIDGPSQPSAFGDLHLVGPNSAARFLSDPSQMYLGI